MFTITPVDQLIIDNVDIIISSDPPPVGGSPNGLGDSIDLQFPPKFSSDGKSGNWRTSDIASYEPLVIFAGANARAISIELTYVCAGGKWTGKYISDIEKMIKSYFYRRIEDSVENTPVVEIYNLYGAVGRNKVTTWRMKDVDIQHGDGLIYDQNEGNAYPLTSKIIMNLETYTQMGGRSNAPPVDAPAKKAEQPAPAPAATASVGAVAQAGAAGEAGQQKLEEAEVAQFQSNLNKNVDSFWY